MASKSERSERTVSDYVLTRDRRLGVDQHTLTEMWRMLETFRKLHWSESEIDLTSDYSHFKTLSPDIQTIIIRVLTFFSFGDAIVMKNVQFNLDDKTNPLSGSLVMRNCYLEQGCMEGIHAIVYLRLLETVVPELDERDKLENEINTVPQVKAIVEWAEKWFRPEYPLIVRIVAFICFEGILFQSKFTFIQFLNQIDTKLMPGLTKSNEFIRRDESTHVHFAYIYFNFLRSCGVYPAESYSEQTVHSIVKECVAVETEFIKYMFSGADVTGLSVSNMIDYIEHVADTHMINMGYNPIFNSPNPFEWVTIYSSLGDKGNIHDNSGGTASVYSVTHVSEIGRAHV